jgi:hypothetical protein
MIMSRFRSMGLAAGAAASVLSCYMVSLRVARERGEVQRIEQQIADAHRDIRDLKTELGTRGRMRQLERWNSDVLALSAPGATQYLNGAVELASYQPVTVDAPAAPATVSATADDASAKAVPAVDVRPAAAPLPQVVTASYKPHAATKPATSDAKLVHTASYKPRAATKPAGPNASLIHTASYVTTRANPPTRVALLDDRVLGDIGRAAAHEVKTGHKAAP